MYLILSLLILAAGLLLLLLPGRLAPESAGGKGLFLVLRLLGAGLVAVAVLFIRAVVTGKIVLPLW